ncbi:MAG TPA: GNAT family N-acetyltransferase [Candidatus Limnocylindrales bacterium]|nr:GNAT family N-acetyltransferase [Candidatus Limnocylindrales bacterium]
MTVAVRRAAIDDAPVVAELFLASFHATYAFPLAHTDDEVRSWIRERLIPDHEVWVATERQQVVGMLALKPGWLEQLYVAPDRLGEGIGRRLMEVAKSRQPDGLQLWTFQVNARARRFYESHGFLAVQETPDHNEEKQPDVRYVWPGASAAPPGGYAAEP